MSDHNLRVDTQLHIAKPPQEVFEAIVNPERMSRYFISWGSGRLDAGNPVTWKWADVGAQLTITPQEVETNRSVSFLWSASGTETRVVIQLDQDGADETVVKVSDSGWPRDAQGTARCLEAMHGWVHMLCCLKAYLEYGINLHSGGVAKKPAV